MSRRKVSIGLFVAGAFLVGLALVTNLFSRSNAWEKLSGATRSAYNAQVLDQLGAAGTGLQAAGTQINEALPALAQAAHMTPAQLQAFMSQFPLTSSASTTFPAFGKSLSATATLLKSQIANFTKADAIPTKTGSSLAVPWFLVITGALAMIVAVLPIRRRALIGSALAIVIGAAVIVMPLATSLPSKTAAADKLNTAVKPVFSTASVTGIHAGLEAVNATITEMSTKFLPAVSSHLPPGLSLTTVFPALTQEIAAVPTLGAAIGQLTNTVSTQIPNYNKVAGTSYRWITWLSILFGAIVAFLGIWGVVGALQTRRDAEVHVMRDWRARHPHKISAAS